MILHYDKVAHVRIECTNSDLQPYTITEEYDWAGVSKTRGRFAVFEVDSNYHSSVSGRIDSKILRKTPRWGATMFVTPKCKTPRELLRKSYKITLDRSKADYIVVPDIVKNIVEDTGRMFLRLDFDNNSKHFTHLLIADVAYQFSNTTLIVENRSTDAVFDAIKAHFKKYFSRAENFSCQKLWSIDFEKYSGKNGYQSDTNVNVVYYVPDVPEFEDILLGNNPLTPTYVYETCVMYDAPTKITPEALWIWNKMNNDDKVLQRTLASSNWREYPYTMAMFLIDKFGSYYNVSSLEGPMQAMWNQLNVRKVYEQITWRHAEANNIISPKDFNMMQDWMFKELGIDGDKGVVSKEDFMKLPDMLRKFAVTRYAIRKINIDKPAVLQELKQNS